MKRGNICNAETVFSSFPFRFPIALEHFLMEQKNMFLPPIVYSLPQKRKEKRTRAQHGGIPKQNKTEERKETKKLIPAAGICSS